MVAGTVDCTPDMLLWRQLGVDFLLAAEDLPPALSLCHTAAGATPQQRHQNRERETQSQPEHAATDRSVAERVAVYRAASPSAPPASPTPPARPAARSSPVSRVSPVAASPAPPSSPPSLPLPPEHWPRPWRERLAATRPAPIIWTYWTLGEDLCGTPNPARRALLRRLLDDLGHPGGTHTFWPAALPSAHPEATALEAHAEAFWSGVSQLKGRAVVVMGSSAVKALELPAGLRPFRQLRHRGCLVVVLRDADLLAEEAQHYDAVREFLRRALAGFKR